MRFLDMTRKPPAGELLPIVTGRRARTVQRLQIGITGVTLMILLVALAGIVQDKARAIDAVTVPEAAPTTASEDAAAAQSDPLVQAGVVPDLPAQPELQEDSANAASTASAPAGGAQ